VTSRLAAKSEAREIPAAECQHEVTLICGECGGPIKLPGHAMIVCRKCNTVLVRLGNPETPKPESNGEQP
jgi:hypothetical protein